LDICIGAGPMGHEGSSCITIVLNYNDLMSNFIPNNGNGTVCHAVFS